jgi:hypothetical protein
MDCAVSGGEWRPPSLFSSPWQRFTAFLDSVGVLRIRMLRFTRDVPFLAFALLRHWLPCLPFEGVDHTKSREKSSHFLFHMKLEQVGYVFYIAECESMRGDEHTYIMELWQGAGVKFYDDSKESFFKPKYLLSRRECSYFCSR